MAGRASLSSHAAVRNKESPHHRPRVRSHVRRRRRRRRHRLENNFPARTQLVGVWRTLPPSCVCRRQQRKKLVIYSQMGEFWRNHLNPRQFFSRPAILFFYVSRLLASRFPLNNTARGTRRSEAAVLCGTLPDEEGTYRQGQVEFEEGCAVDPSLLPPASRAS